MVNIKLFDSLEFSKDGAPILEGLLNTRKKVNLSLLMMKITDVNFIINIFIN